MTGTHHRTELTASRMTSTIRRRIVVALAMTVLVGGCGLPVQEQPQAQPSLDAATPVASASVTDPGAPATSSPEPSSREGELLVYFVTEEGLVPVPREAGLTPAGVVEAIVQGPTLEEQRLGLASLLKADDVEFAGTSGALTALVSLTAAFDELTAEEQRLAIAQVVLSLDDSGVATSVFFQRGGVPLVLPDAAGIPVSGQVTRADVQDLLVPTGTATT